MHFRVLFYVGVIGMFFIHIAGAIDDEIPPLDFKDDTDMTLVKRSQQKKVSKEGEKQMKSIEKTIREDEVRRKRARLLRYMRKHMKDEMVDIPKS